MTRGKRTCKILKEIRQQIADKNDIEYVTSECHYQGECKGTCPKCEAELRYLESELQKRKLMGKAAVIAGISLGIAGTFSACKTHQQTNMPIVEQETVTNPMDFDEPYHDLIGMIFEPFDSSTIWNDNTPKYHDDDYIWVFVEVYPEFPGGEAARKKFIADNIKYPKELQGIIIVSFVVEIDGSLTNFEVIRKKHPILDEEALRIAKLMPKWKPGEQNGKAVRVRFRMPVHFTMQ